MKTFKITSPAYKANGLKGTYYSVAICNDNNLIVDIVGDHNLLIDSYKDCNIALIEGLSFSDSDRFISIKEVAASIDELSLHIKKYAKWSDEINEWSKRKLTFCNGDVYDFLYDKKGQKRSNNEDLYNEWLLKNPCPESVEYYDFLKAINSED